ncbi:hypothetical protein D3C71_1597510 [compost metagenome]
MYAHIGVAEGAAHVQGRTQGKDAEALAVGRDVHIDLFVFEVGAAGNADQGIFGVEDKNARRHLAVLHDKVGGAAIDIHFIVAEQFGHHVVAHVQAGNLHQAAADDAVVDQHFDVAGGRAQQRRHRIAGAADGHVAIEFTQRLLHGVGGGKQLL